MPYLGKEPKNITTLSDLSVSGNVTSTGTVEPAGDTAAGDDAAIGFTSAEGLILTGQGSTSDITLKNDADAVVFSVPTGTDDILFPDNAKAIFGAGSDLKIYHNGGSSFIEDSGSGNLTLLADEFRLNNAGNTENMITAAPDGAVTLFHNDSAKIATTSSGIDITGGFTATDGSTITTADNTVQLTLKSTDADGSIGPKFDLTRDSSSPANGDNCGQINFNIDNNAGESTQYGDIFVGATSVTDGSESAHMTFSTMKGGSRNSRMKLHSDETVFNEDSVDVDFRVESDNEANALFVQGSSGNVGIGTNAPSFGTTSSAGLEIAHATRGILRLEGNSAAQALELYGDSTGGTIDARGSGAVLAFDIGGSEKMRLDSNGKLYLGTTSTIAGAHISHLYDSVNGSGLTMSSTDSSGNTHNQVIFIRNGSTVGVISTNSSNTTFGTSSDRRLKSNIQDAASASSKIDAIQVRQFDWNVDNSHQDYGLIAQELQPIEPMAVLGNADSDEMMSVDYSKLVPMLLKEIQELRSRVAALEE